MRTLIDCRNDFLDNEDLGDQAIYQVRVRHLMRQIPDSEHWKAFALAHASGYLSVVVCQTLTLPTAIYATNRSLWLTLRSC